MAILVDDTTRVCVQGITGRIGRVQAEYMLAAGTRIVAGVTPGKGGECVADVPVFGSVAESQAACPADATVLFVPPVAAEQAATDAIEAGVALVVVITEGVPVHAAMRLREQARRAGVRLLGPTTPGIVAPGRCKIGIMPVQLFARGPVGVLSRSGTLSYEISALLTSAGIGQSTVVGVGADPVVGTDVSDLLELYAADPETAAVVLIGEVGGGQEEQAAAALDAGFPKPLIAYIAGSHAPRGVRMGHAGAIVQGSSGSAADKCAVLQDSGARIAARPADVVELVRSCL